MVNGLDGDEVCVCACGERWMVAMEVRLRLAATGCMVTVGTGTYCYGSGERMDRTMNFRYRDFGAKEVANE